MAAEHDVPSATKYRRRTRSRVGDFFNGLLGRRAAGTMDSLGVVLLQADYLHVKSSKTFCFFVLIPALCQSSPYSPPPRILGTA